MDRRVLLSALVALAVAIPATLGAPVLAGTADGGGPLGVSGSSAPSGDRATVDRAEADDAPVDTSALRRAGGRATADSSFCLLTRTNITLHNASMEVKKQIAEGLTMFNQTVETSAPETKDTFTFFQEKVHAEELCSTLDVSPTFVKVILTNVSLWNVSITGPATSVSFDRGHASEITLWVTLLSAVKLLPDLLTVDAVREQIDDETMEDLREAGVTDSVDLDDHANDTNGTVNGTADAADKRPTVDAGSGPRRPDGALGHRQAPVAARQQATVVARRHDSVGG